ncbi:MAG TPA: hypothetical protein VM599_01195 [Thermoanaerobaculia bacterium]|nr:hypothetical protein [Thermoanaerobaculia bacterium]
MKHLLLVPYTFVLLNWAAMTALYCVLRGRGLESVWREPSRGPAGPRATLLGPAKP